MKMSSKENNDIAGLINARARPIMDLVDELRAMGVDKDVPIPQIAVMGDQSSGKSSVLEALSGISFPRGAGLVTRCPTQVNMSRGSIWRAEISCPARPNIHHVLTEAEQESIPNIIEDITNELATVDGGFPDWKDQNNYIVVSVTSAACPDLTIIDLPGLVRTTTTGQDKSVIDIVDSMLNHFLKQPRTCILAVLPANVDLALSEILERAEKVDPTGRRTIGVLTKPDLVDRGGETEVISVLRNIKKPLQHGYFMLKNRSQEELNNKMNLADARKSEAAYFASSPYQDVAQDHLGINALAAALSDLLVQQIQESLPAIKIEVNEALKTAEDELLGLGDAPPDSPLAQKIKYSSVVSDILNDLRALMSGSDATGISNRNILNDDRIARKKFVDEILGTKPGFNGENDLFESQVTDVGTGTLNEGVVEKKVGDTCDKRCSWNNKKSTTHLGATMTHSYSTKGCVESKVSKYHVYFRGELCNLIEERRGRELPGFMNFKVFSSLMSDYVRRWVKPATLYQEKVKQIMSAAVTSLTDKHAQSWQNLSFLINLQLQNFLEENQKKVLQRLERLIIQECSPSTENHYLWDTINKIRNERIEKMIQGMSEATVYSNARTLCEGHVKKTEVIALLKSKLEGDASNESQEVQDMIDMLSAYWKLAMKRYVDHVAMIITDLFTHKDLVQDVEKIFQNHQFKINDKELANLFSQTKRMKKKRNELEKRVATMQRASIRLSQGICSE